MTLLWADGFEGMGTSLGATSPTGIIASKYIGLSGLPTVVAGRNDVGRALNFGSSTTYMRTPVLNTTNATMIVSFAYKKADNVSPGYLVQTYEVNNWNAALLDDGYGRLKLARTSIVLGITPAFIKSGRWYWIEWKTYVHATAGTMELRVGGQSMLSLSGVNTKAISAAYQNKVLLRGGGSNAKFDDFFVCDGAGTVNNDFLGNRRIETLRPDGDDTLNWATSTPNANHYANVDDEESDVDTSYVAESTTSTKDLYTYGNTSNLVTVDGLMVNNLARTDSGASETLQTIVSSAGTEATTNNSFTSTTYTHYTVVEEQDPDASAAWTTATVDAAKFGYNYI